MQNPRLSSAEFQARLSAKAPKARLNELIRAGFLPEGEQVFLVDYQGIRRKHPKVTVAGTRLQVDGQQHSMSHLARELLKQAGFKSDFVRGPAHWVNAKERVREADVGAVASEADNETFTGARAAKFPNRESEPRGTNGLRLRP